MPSFACTLRRKYLSKIYRNQISEEEFEICAQYFFELLTGVKNGNKNFSYSQLGSWKNMNLEKFDVKKVDYFNYEVHLEG